MADAINTTGSLNLSQAAWELRAIFPLRAQLRYSQLATVQSTNASMRGASVNFYNVNDLAVDTTPLSETTDVDAKAFTDSVFNIALAEFGNSMATSAKLRGTSFLPVEPVVANIIGRNAGVTYDNIARDNLIAGITTATNVVYGESSGTAAANEAALTAGHVLTANILRVIYAKLVMASVEPVDADGNYVLLAHPAQIKDLRAETGGLGWFEAAKFGDPSRIFNGEVGTFEGFRIVSTPRAPWVDNVGAGTSPNKADAFKAVALGRDALAMAHSTGEGGPGGGFGPMPTIYPVPPTDHLQRTPFVSWYWLGNFKAFRSAASWLIETGSSVAVSSQG